MRAHKNYPSVALTRYFLYFGLETLILDSWVWILCFGFLGLDSGVWIPGFGFLGLDSWVWFPGLGVLGLDSWIWTPGLNLTDVCA